jgi:hypothetical protein
MEQPISQQNILLILDTLLFEEVIKTETRNRIVKELKELTDMTASSFKEAFIKIIDRLEYKRQPGFSASAQYRYTDSYQETIEDKNRIYEVTIIKHIK